MVRVRGAERKGEKEGVGEREGGRQGKGAPREGKTAGRRKRVGVWGRGRENGRTEVFHLRISSL